MAQVLVVGAGPVGLVMAAELARYGVDFRIIDKCAHPTETSKALVIWSRTLELTERMGCVGSFLDAGLRAHGATIRGDGGAVLGQADFSEVASPYNFALMIPQSATERLLAAHLQSLGVSVEREVTLESFTAESGSVAVQLHHAGGNVENVAVLWLIGCDGAHSAVRHGLGLEFKGTAQGDDWLLADVRLDGDRAPPADEIATYLHRDGPFVIFPIPGGRARVVADLGPANPAGRPAPTLGDVQTLVDCRAGGGFRAVDPVWLTGFRINERKVSEYTHGRVFLAGDAAHIHSPAGGQGMNTGIQDAVNLAWKLAMVSSGAAAPALLASYSPERSAVGDTVLRNATLLTDMATLSNPAARAARNIALRVLLGLRPIQHRLVSTMSEADIGYSSSSLSSGRKSGARIAPEQYRGTPPGAGSTPRFVLYTSAVPQGVSLAKRFPALLEARPRNAPKRDELLIVRPDGYIGFAGSDDDWDEATEYLARISADYSHAERPSLQI